MQRTAIESSVLKSVAYDRSTATLEIQFVEGDVYRYYDFPEFLYRGLMLAASKGQFFNGRISGRYRFERVAASLPDAVAKPEA